VTIDLGTGDGRLPYVLARDTPDRLFVGIDANAAGLCRFSGRADRERLGNLVYVRAAAESLPSELTVVADRVKVILPWGSLLAAVAAALLDMPGARAPAEPERF
jgi:tRNA G46 methylase TrmB